MADDHAQKMIESLITSEHYFPLSAPVGMPGYHEVVTDLGITYNIDWKLNATIVCVLILKDDRKLFGSFTSVGSMDQQAINSAAKRDALNSISGEQIFKAYSQVVTVTTPEDQESQSLCEISYNRMTIIFWHRKNMHQIKDRRDPTYILCLMMLTSKLHEFLADGDVYPFAKSGITKNKIRIQKIAAKLQSWVAKPVLSYIWNVTPAHLRSVDIAQQAIFVEAFHGNHS